MNYKKGVSEPASDIAALILLILLSTIIYVILLPPAERDALLGDNETTDGNIYGPNYVAEETLLSASPGKVHPLTKDKITKEITPISLFTKTEESKVALSNSLSVSKSIFSEEIKQLSFKIDDISNLDSAKLFFFVKESSGTIFIELNGNTIYEGKLSQDNVPISLPASSLRANNILRVGAKGIWWDKFFLSDIYVKTSYIFENTRAKRTFEMSSREKTNMEKATLSYYINCFSIKEKNILSLILNNKLLSDDYIACDAGKRTLELNNNNIVSGTNTLEFRTDTGNYDIQSIEIQIEAGDKIFPSYNFEVTNEIYKKLFSPCYNNCEADCSIDCDGDSSCYNSCLYDCDSQCNKPDIILELTFGDDSRKKASITINEFEININTQSQEYTRVISDYIKRGDNVIKIIPKSSFDITNLRVFVIDYQKINK